MQTKSVLLHVKQHKNESKTYVAGVRLEVGGQSIYLGQFMRQIVLHAVLHC